VNYWKVILATVVIFGTGVFTGGLLVNSIQHPHPKNKNRPAAANVETHPPAEAHESHTNNLTNLPRPRPPEILGDKFVQQLDDALQLTPDQRASIQKIIADGQERNHSIWTNNSAQMRAVVQDVRHRVRETLTAEQQKQFEELMKRVPRRQNATNAPASLPLTNSAAIAPTNAAAN
jgi:Spy/CpxP family protein refolding chaperone